MADPEEWFLDVKKGVTADNQDIQSSETDARTLTRMYGCGEISCTTLINVKEERVESRMVSG
jgi:hypothetical protein